MRRRWDVMKAVLLWLPIIVILYIIGGVLCTLYTGGLK